MRIYFSITNTQEVFKSKNGLLIAKYRKYIIFILLY